MNRSVKLDKALDEVRRQIEAVVLEEQLRDQLTGLANSALGQGFDQIDISDMFRKAELASRSLD